MLKRTSRAAARGLHKKYRSCAEQKLFDKADYVNSQVGPRPRRTKRITRWVGGRCPIDAAYDNISNLYRNKQRGSSQSNSGGFRVSEGSSAHPLRHKLKTKCAFTQIVFLRASRSQNSLVSFDTCGNSLNARSPERCTPDLVPPKRKLIRCILGPTRRNRLCTGPHPKVINHLTLALTLPSADPPPSPD